MSDKEKTWLTPAVFSAIFLLAAALLFLNHRLVVIELTSWSWVLVSLMGVVGGVAGLLLIERQSRSGASNQKMTYLRQVKYRRWLAILLSGAVVLGLLTATLAWALLGQLVRLLPTRDYSIVRAEVLDRFTDDPDLFNCRESLDVRTEAGAEIRLCLERGAFWSKVPGELVDVQTGDRVVVYLRRTALGSAAEVAKSLAPGQEFSVE